MSPNSPASFVIRLWQEQSGAESEWRWHAVHVQSGLGQYCSSISQVMEFVSECAEGATPPLPYQAEVRRGGCSQL